MQSYCLAFIFLILSLPFNLALSGQDNKADNQLLEMGKKIYQQGVTSDNTPLQAILSEDVSVSGEQIACIKCHQRSGLGALESSVISWPVSGKALYQARRRSGAWSSSLAAKSQDLRANLLPSHFDPADDRVAYTDITIARALREGMDSSGSRLSGVMPRYELTDYDMQALIAYLKSISANYSPGVDESTIRFATVISDTADPDDTAAMLDVLKKHIANHNSQTRPHVKRIETGPFYRSEMNSAYRHLQLDIWSLKGDPKTWAKQLLDYYQQQPVFALLGGLIDDQWQIVHQFCEQNQIPAIFPITDFPVISDNDWYTLYFSKGVYQQGESAARFLKTLEIAGNTEIVQVFTDTNSGRRYAEGFRQSWQFNESATLIDHRFTTTKHFDETILKKRNGRSTIWLLWLDDENAISQVTQLLANEFNNDDLYIASWDLVLANAQQIDPGIAERFYFTFPQALPAESARKKARLKQWLKISGIESRNMLVEDKMYFLGWMLSAVIKNMRNDFYRDYFLENFEMMREQNRAIAHFPHVSFAPGQRYIAKGSYIVQLDRENNEPIKVSEWSVY